LAGQLADAPSVTVLGNGSNLLVADDGTSGVVLALDAIDEVTIAGTVVTAGAGADLPKVARACVEAGLSGFTWAVGVPGTIGGAVAMNAGGHGSDMAASLTDVILVDLRGDRTGTVAASDLDLSYRHSNLQPEHVVASATLTLARGSAAEERLTLREIVAWRRANQPGGRNCGSVFVNPEGTSAGRLIADAGLKDFRIGGAAVSSKHANFIQADDGATAADVVAVIRAVQRRVRDTTGIALQTELRMVGFGDEELR
jgi:UDP-N-acetylmuramate dehydrogenase